TDGIGALLTIDSASVTSGNGHRGIDQIVLTRNRQGHIANSRPAVKDRAFVTSGSDSNDVPAPREPIAQSTHLHLRLKIRQPATDVCIASAGDDQSVTWHEFRK